MKKLLTITLLLTSGLSFAASNTINMETLKCNNLHINSNTSLHDVITDCQVYKVGWYNSLDNMNMPNKYFPEGLDKMYEVQFMSDNDTNLIRCDFYSDSPQARIIGCRNNY